MTTVDQAFSDQLEQWLESDDPKTLGTMGDVFAEKSFAVTILLLMFVPSLPLPTGGVTHVFEAIVVVLTAQMIIGRRTIWLPDRWQRRELGATLTGKAIPFIVRRVRWFERDLAPARGRPVRPALVPPPARPRAHGVRDRRRASRRRSRGSTRCPRWAPS